ncbi:hypothetical protein GRI40_10990 [Altererythrobacter aerius]|uniref:Tetratricopeptide repeat protein n=1 Tax=Tsuneonella aeria TaxID=1837929 RepID=A0A6I4TES1_9SPHN|nr:hypothetical protein [Tsuneonella aeria]MXO75742.1 hypothetical protein [Tsuneonella aeria]
MYRIAFLGLASLSASATIAQTPATQTADLVERAERVECPMFDRDMIFVASDEEIEAEEKRVSDLCMKRFDALQAAAKSADLDEETSHRLSAAYIETSIAHGRNLVETGKPAEALNVLGSGYQQMMAHFDNGSHYHTLFENLPLFYELHRALALTGRAPEAAGTLTNARQLVDQALEANKTPDHPNGFLIRSTLRTAYQLEKNLGIFWSETSADIAAQGRREGASKARAYALDALNRWLLLADSDIGTVKTPAVKTSPDGAEALREIARVQFAAGDKQGASTSLAAAVDRVCTPPNANDRRAAMCKDVREDQRILAGSVKGDISPKGRFQMAAEIAEIQGRAIGNASGANARVRQALDAL